MMSCSKFDRAEGTRDREDVSTQHRCAVWHRLLAVTLLTWGL